MNKIYPLVFAILAFVLFAGGTQAGSTGVSKMNVMCAHIPKKDMGVLMEPCTTYYNQRHEAIIAIKAIVKKSAEATSGVMDSATEYGKIWAHQVTVNNYLTAFQMSCESVYADSSYPKELAAALEREREAMALAIEAYSNLAWISVAVTNDVYGFNDNIDELDAKFKKMLEEDFIPLDKQIADALNWKIVAGYGPPKVKDFNTAQNALIVMSTVMRTLGNWKTGYSQIIENLKWDNKKDAYHTDIVEQKMTALAELYSGEKSLNEWDTIYADTQGDRDTLSDLYKDKWGELKKKYEAYFPEGENIFAWFRRNHKCKVDYWSESEPYSKLKKLHREIVEVME